MKRYTAWGAGTMAIKLSIETAKNPDDYDSLLDWYNAVSGSDESTEWIKTDCEVLNHIEEITDQEEL